MRWLKLEIHFPSFYSYRIPDYSSQYALALPLIAPSTIKLAIVSTAIRISGRVEEGKRIFDYVKDAKVGIKLPKTIAINNVFIKRLKKKDGVSINIEGVSKTLQTNKGINIYMDTEMPVFKIGERISRGYYIPGRVRVQIGEDTLEVSDLIIWDKELKIINKNSSNFKLLQLTKEDKKNLSKQEQKQKKRELEAQKDKFEKQYKGRLEAFLFEDKRKLPVRIKYSGDFIIYTIGDFTVIEPKNKQELRFENFFTLAPRFQQSFGVREYIHFGENLYIYLGFNKIELPENLLAYAQNIRYIGTGDSIIYVRDARWTDEAPQDVIFPLELSKLPEGVLIYPVKDFKKNVKFEQVNPYSKTKSKNIYEMKYYPIKIKKVKEGKNWRLLII